jgi:transcriptional regulator with GAF, ATPase, and Fis domain
VGDEAIKIELQREFYELLQNLGKHSPAPIEQQFEQALNLVVKKTGAAQGYLEIRNNYGDTFHRSYSLSEQEIESVQQRVSTGIIAKAISSKQAIVTSTAFLDPRFNAFESVRLDNIEAVLCAPFNGARAQGVIYLQGDSQFQAESDQVQFDAQQFVEFIVPFLDQLVLEYEQATDHDPTHILRQKYSLQGIIGSSEGLYKVLKSATTVARLDVNVLLLGESGTGKTEIAHAIHINSKRARHPFVEINCGAFQDTLFESELFGTVRGAFNDARNKPGKIISADKGTLFLDELGELSTAAQVKLLQFLHSGEFYPVGSDKKVKADVRLLFATNKDLPELVQRQQFREDLFFRVNTFPIEIPALRDRSDDIRQLSEHFCQLSCVKHGFPALSLSPEAHQALTNRSWPGNIRELANLIERACINAIIHESSTIEPTHIFDIDSGQKTSEEHSRRQQAYIGQSFQEATKNFQKQLVANSLRESNGDVKAAAKILSLSKSHMYNLVSELDLAPKLTSEDNLQPSSEEIVFK